MQSSSTRVSWFGKETKVIQILRNKLRPHWALLAVLAVYLVVTLVYGMLNPIGEAPDEVAHVRLIQFIGQQGHLPLNPAERLIAGYKSDSPMLYHALIGLATRWVDYDSLPTVKVSLASPRYLLIEDGRASLRLVHTDDEAFPYRGVVLLWHLSRLISTLLSAATLVVVYAIALEVRPGAYGQAVGVTAVVAALPRFHFMASAVNDDNLLGLLAALFMLAVLRAWRQPARRSTYAWIGLWLGLALTTKYSLILLPLLVVIVLARAVRRRELDWRSAAGRLLLCAAVTIAAAAWWFVYLEWNFNQVQEVGWLAGLIKPLAFDTSTQEAVSLVTGNTSTAANLGALPSDITIGDWRDWATAFFQSFWFVPGEASTAAVTALSWLFLGLSCLAALGLGWAWYRRDDLPRATLGLLACQLGLVLPFPVLRFYMTHNLAETAQGRHALFPAVAAVGLLLTAGVSAWLPAARRRPAGLALAGGLLAVSLVTFLGLTLPALPPSLPVRTTADAVQDVPNPVHALFGDSLELVGYQVGAASRDGMLPVTLVWHSHALVKDDYFVRLSLLDRGGRVRSLWLGQPVNGRYPTRAWDEGDVVRDTVWLPLAGVEGGDYGLQLCLYTSDDTCLPSKQGQPELYLTDVAIPSLPAHSPAHSAGPAGFDVWQAGQPASGVPLFRYRAAVPVTMASPISNSVSLVGPDNVPQSPQAQAGQTYIFLVDARWLSGEYRLRVGEPAFAHVISPCRP
jgi:hypothetical protein